MSRFDFVERGEIKAVIHRANGSHKGERTIGVSVTQKIVEIDDGQYVGVRTVKFDQPITIHKGEILSIKNV
jgi:hypothetical protein